MLQERQFAFLNFSKRICGFSFLILFQNFDMILDFWLDTKAIFEFLNELRIKGYNVRQFSNVVCS